MRKAFKLRNRKNRYTVITPVLVVCTIVLVATLLVVNIGTIKEAEALDTDADVISEIINSDMSDFDESAVDRVVKEITQSINAPSTGNIGRCCESAKIAYERIFGTENVKDCVPTLMKIAYETYLYSADEFSVRCLVVVNDTTYSVSGTEQNGNIIISGIDKVYVDMARYYRSRVGDAPEDEDIQTEEEPIADVLVDDTDITEGMTEEELDWYNETGWLSHKGDEGGESENE